MPKPPINLAGRIPSSPQLPAPNWENRFDHQSVNATDGATILKTNSAITLVTLTMQVSADCVVQLYELGKAVSNAFRLKADTIWSAPSRYVANNTRLILKVSAGTVNVGVSYIPGHHAEGLLNYEDRFYNLTGTTVVAGIVPTQYGGTGQDFSATGGAHSFLAQDAAHIVSVRPLTADDLPNLISYSGALPYLPNLVTRKIQTASVAGDNDLYTVPAGKRAFAILSTWNATGGTIAHFTEVKIGGVYYRTGAAIAGLNGTAGTPFYLIVLEAGQSFSLNCAALGLYIVGTVYEFDNTSALKSYMLTAFAVGDNAFSPVPVGKKFSVQIGSPISTASGAGTLCIVNNSGGSLAYTWNLVPNGGAVLPANRILVTAGVATGATSFVSLNATLEAGDFFSLASTSAGAQIAWVTGSEY